jgi:hypothetical protein
MEEQTMTPKQHYRKVMSRGKMAPVDMDRYPKRRGLEGPFRFRNGRIVYYDPKEGKYYDSETDMYLSDKETMKLHEAEDRNAGYALVGFARRVEEGRLDAYIQSRDDAQLKRRLERWLKDSRSSKADPEALRYLAKSALVYDLMSADDPNPEASLEELGHLLGFEGELRGLKGDPLRPKYMKMLVGLGKVYGVNFKQEIERGRKDSVGQTLPDFSNLARARRESEEDIFTVLGPGTPVGESNSGRGFHWEAVNRKVDRLGKQMESVLSDAFGELELRRNTDHQEAAEKMKEYLEATFNEVRDSVERYEEAAIKRSKRGSRRR